MAQVKYPPETYSEKEQQCLLEFRNKLTDLELKPEQLQDSYLIRWLRARSLNSDKAHEMLKKHLEWRKEKQVDGILERETIPPELMDDAPYAMCGVDKDGYPIIIVPVGRQDIRSRVEKHGPQILRRYNLITCEKLMKLLQDMSEEQGRPVTQFVEIMDLEGFSYRQITSKMCRDLFTSMQTELDANYPELLRHAMMINTPKFFYILFSIMKPIIPKETLDKIHVFGSDKEKWKKAVVERFPPELIPPYWGGTRPGVDQYCSDSDMWRQGKVPDFFQDNTTSTDDPTLTETTVNARAQLKIELKVTKPNCSICWRFRTDGYDIGFEILGDNKTIILPQKRVQSHKQIEEGSLTCSALGNYTVVFDNSYSWTTGKKLWYSVSLLDPEEME